tara:strand:+ start:1002 stop:1352 length:351 start_codon:yes stop_codon:yes gene_type:complete
MAEKKGPRRLIESAVKIGEYGNTKWHVQLECGHSVDRVRKPKIGEDRISCKACIEDGKSTALVVSQDLGEYDAYNDLKTRAAIASHFGVQIEQVEMNFGTATVFLDSVQIKRIASA